MTNFRMKYSSFVSEIARETDLQSKLQKSTHTSLRKATRVKLEL